MEALPWRRGLIAAMDGLRGDAPLVQLRLRVHHDVAVLPAPPPPAPPSSDGSAATVRRSRRAGLALPAVPATATAAVPTWQHPDC